MPYNNLDCENKAAIKARLIRELLKKPIHLSEKKTKLLPFPKSV